MTITTDNPPTRTRRRRPAKPADHTAAVRTTEASNDLTEVSGVLDLTDRQAILRTAGYLPGSNDVTVPGALVRGSGLRRGDLIAGAASTTGGRGDKRTLIRLDSVNDLPSGTGDQTP